MTVTSAELSPDFETREVVIALAVAILVPVLVTGSLHGVADRGYANAPTIVAGDAIPIRVKPVIDFDAPLLKLGSKKKQSYKLPDMWAPKPKAVQKKRVVRRAFASTKAKDEASAAPPKDIPVAPASVTPPAASAEVIRQQEEEVTETPTEEPSNIPEGPGSTDGSAEGTEVDPLKARAASMYAGRIRRFLRARFHVAQCTEEMGALSVGWSATLASGGQVTSCSINPSGNGTLDGAAKAACAAAKGQQIPPPSNYPEFGSRSVGGRFRCQVTNKQ